LGDPVDVSAPSPLDLAVVIVNFNTRELLPDCLRTLRTALAGLRCETWVVDNASSDGSAALVRADYPWVRLLEAPRNVGYGAANNLALRALGFDPSDASCPRAPAVLLLNPDTEVEPRALRALLEFLDGHSEVGVVGPRLVRPDGRLDKACRRAEPTPLVSVYHFLGLGRLFPNSPRFARYNMTFVPDDRQLDVDSVVGACMLIRSTALRAAGLFDERFFMYGEDLDLCLRIRRQGWRVVYVPGAQVLHHKGRATRKASAAMVREFYRSMALFHAKHYASRCPWPVNLGVYSGVHLLAWLKQVENALRPAARRAVGSGD
jgi:N-acetylglucosaminyl-diphospho-decaprenol L-rhamnosyltransferase